MTPAPESKSEVARLFGVVWEPQAALRDIAARPRPWTPLVLLALVSLLFSYAFSQRVGWERFMRQQMDTNPRLQERMQSMPAEQRERAMEMQARIASIASYVASVFALPILALIAGGILLFAFKAFLGAQFTFPQVFAIVSYALLPLVLSSLMGLGVMFMKDPNDFDLQRPTLTNVGAFLDPLSTPKWLLSLTSSLDIFSFWILALLATGLSTADPKVSWGKSLACVAGIWAILVLLKACWAATFG
jgi:hypothetical protein